MEKFDLQALEGKMIKRVFIDDSGMFITFETNSGPFNFFLLVIVVLCRGSRL